eukprot:GHVU01219400.1.p1 GENE.GHVU01219400.1~~GHVU01219400.1.p1  ORF type:complete len:112 (-),score=9.22 GHVU01219400.1:71-406(-)
MQHFRSNEADVERVRRKQQNGGSSGHPETLLKDVHDGAREKVCVSPTNLYTDSAIPIPIQIPTRRHTTVAALASFLPASACFGVQAIQQPTNDPRSHSGSQPVSQSNTQSV